MYLRYRYQDVSRGKGAKKVTIKSAVRFRVSFFFDWKGRRKQYKLAINLSRWNRGGKNLKVDDYFEKEKNRLLGEQVSMLDLIRHLGVKQTRRNDVGDFFARSACTYIKRCFFYIVLVLTWKKKCRCIRSTRNKTSATYHTFKKLITSEIGFNFRRLCTCTFRESRACVSL